MTTGSFVADAGFFALVGAFRVEGDLALAAGGDLTGGLAGLGAAGSAANEELATAVRTATARIRAEIAGRFGRNGVHGRILLSVGVDEDRFPPRGERMRVFLRLGQGFRTQNLSLRLLAAVSPQKFVRA